MTDRIPDHILSTQTVVSELAAIEQLLRELRDSLLSSDPQTATVVLGTLRLAGGRCYALVGALSTASDPDD